jgi:hypothetical protein
MSNLGKFAISFEEERKAASGIPRVTYVSWLIVFLFLAILRRKIIQGGGFNEGHLDLTKLIGNWSVLEVIGWFWVFRLIPRHSTGSNVSLVECFVVFAYLTFVLLLYDPQGFFFVVPLFIYLALRFGLDDEFQKTVVCCLILVFAPFLSGGPFLWLHEKMAYLDASIVGFILRGIGYSVSVDRTVLIAGGGEHGIDIWAGCATTFNLGLLIGSFAILVLARRRLRSSDGLWAMALVLAIAIVNWMRLSAMAFTWEWYEYWHAGSGATIVSLIEALLVLAIAKLATRSGVDTYRA